MRQHHPKVKEAAAENGEKSLGRLVEDTRLCILVSILKGRLLEEELDHETGDTARTPVDESQESTL